MPQTPETPLQFDMFTGVLVDTRTDRQKRQDKEAAQPKPVEMFSTAEIAQFGVNAHPLLPISDNTRLMLIPEDHHTPEEIDQDIQRQAEKLTNPLFPDAQEPPSEPPVALLSAWCETTIQTWNT